MFKKDTREYKEKTKEKEFKVELFTKCLKQMKERVSQTRYKLLEKYLFELDKAYEDRTYVHWKKRLRKGDIGECIVYMLLERIGYTILPFPIKDEGSISFERRKEKAKKPKYPDAHAVSLKGEPIFGYHFLVDPKYRTKMKDLGVINQSTYLDYWNIHQLEGTLEIPFYLFYTIKETSQVWYCQVRDPYQKPSLEDTLSKKYRSPTYQIPINELTIWRECPSLFKHCKIQVLKRE